jgi:hypothetical protein
MASATEFRLDASSGLHWLVTHGAAREWICEDDLH